MSLPAAARLIILVLLISILGAQDRSLQPPSGKVAETKGLYELNDIIVTATGHVVGIGSSNLKDSRVKQGWWLSWDTNDGLVENQLGEATTYAGYDALLTIANEGYLAVGTIFISEEQQYDGLVVNIDEAGNILWTVHFGGVRWDWLKAVVADGSGGYFLTGWTDSFGSGDSDIFLLNIDREGRELYRRTFGGFDNEWANESLVLANGTLVVAGATATYSIGGDDIWVLGLDKAGEKIWERTLGGYLDEEAQSMVAINDSEFVVLANVAASKDSQQHLILIGFSNSGQVLWTSTLKSSGGMMATNLLGLPGNRLVVVGTLLAKMNENSDVLLLGTDQLGQEVWRKTYGGLAPDMSMAGVADADGVIYIAAKTYSYGRDEGTLWMFKTDADGNMLNQLTNQGDR